MLKAINLILFSAFIVAIFTKCGGSKSNAFQKSQASDSARKLIVLPDPLATVNLVSPSLEGTIRPNLAQEYQWQLTANRNIELSMISCFVNGVPVKRALSSSYTQSGKKAKFIPSISEIDYNVVTGTISSPVLLDQGRNQILLIIDIEGDLFYNLQIINLNKSSYKIDSLLSINNSFTFPLFVTNHLNNSKIIKTGYPYFLLSYKSNISTPLNGLNKNDIYLSINNSEYRNTSNSKIFKLSTTIKVTDSILLDNFNPTIIDIKIKNKNSFINLPTLIIKRDSLYKPNLHILSIGPVLGNLFYTIQDAREFANLFSLQKNYINRPYQSILIDTLLGIEATKSNIVNRFITLKNRANLLEEFRPDDVIITFISSHGNFSGTRDNKDRLFYITPSFGDENQLSSTCIDFIKDIKNNLNSINCKKIIFLDACHSGGKKAINIGNIDKIISSSSSLSSYSEPIILASSSNEEYSYEIEELKQGIFTNFIREGALNGAADQNRDRIVNLIELSKYLTKEVSEYIKIYKNNLTTQTPQLNRENLNNLPLFFIK